MKNQTILFKFVLWLVLVCFVDSTEVVTFENEQFGITCGHNEGIKIYDASWTYVFWDLGNMFQPDMRNGAYVAGGMGLAGDLCTYDVVGTVKQKCEGKNNCHFAANRNLFPTAGALLDSAVTNCHYNMKLIVNYDCLPCNNGPRFKRMLGIQCDSFTDLVPRLNNQWSDRIGCPHQSFVTKHICEGCIDAAWAAEQFAMGSSFQRTHGQTVNTPLNTVFVLNHVPMTYHEAGDANCVFDRLAVKYNCRSNAYNNGWTCNRIGNIRATHDLINGHYLYHQDRTV